MVSCGQKIEHENDQTNDLHPYGLPKDWTIEAFNKNDKEQDDKKENNSDDEQEQGCPLVEKQTGRICLHTLLATGGYFLQWMVTQN